MVRYKVKFTVTSELLFKHIAKFIPVDDLHIEEFVDVPMPPLPKAPPAVVALAEKFKARAEAKKKRASPRKSSFNPDKGLNKVILDALDDGQSHRAMELATVSAEGGYSPTSINSLMVKLIRRGLIVKTAPGVYKKAHVNVSHTEKADRITRAIDQLDPEGIPET